MSVFQSRIKDGLLLSGAGLLLLSACIFCSPLFYSFSDDQSFPFFIFHFAIAIIYAFILISNKSTRSEAHRNFHTIILLMLFLISAYALNRLMVVFAESAPWLCVWLVLICLNYSASVFWEAFPAWLRHVVFIIFGAGAVFFIYLSVYLMPIYLISVFGLLFFGASIHAFIPVLFVYHSIKLGNRLSGGNKQSWYSFFSGAAATLIIAGIYIVQWSATVNNLNTAYREAVSEGSKELPAWIQIAKVANGDNITEKVLKSGLVYTVPDWSGSDIFWRMPRRTLGEQQPLHDPLVILGSLFSQPLLLNDEDKIKVLKAGFNSRHAAEEKFWSGKDLRTTDVASSIRIWPQYHIAYTEKIVTVFNHAITRWRTPEEALYTFQLPEGGVVTSLSLWINGLESKGILTTKEKADSAYNRIVGIESRPASKDPSVVHWQEGNRVTVRVFPVEAAGSRSFKIGITAPLTKVEDKVVYQNISFDGPDAGNASERIKLMLDQQVENATASVSLNTEEPKLLTRSGNYRPYWSYSFHDSGLAPDGFSFNGSHYGVKPYVPQRIPVIINDLYLDINSSWTKTDFEQITQMANGRKLWVYDNELTALTNDNRQRLFKKLSAQLFSLFPLYDIHDTEHALLISKTGSPSPNLSDLEGSPFLNRLKSFSAAAPKIKLFNIGQDCSSYLASLKEFRFFDYENGSLTDLEILLKASRFAEATENDSSVVVYNAGMIISKDKGETKGAAPDHLMRLFTYNHLLQKWGKKGLTTTTEDSSGIAEAKEACIVSPVSSLVVLESQADYDRFGIQESKNSLYNASLKSKGAVPEPHEWLLIILVIAIAFVLFIKSRI